MKVLIFSHDWAPSVGGVQTAITSLALGIVSRATGEDTRLLGVVTKTPADKRYDRQYPFIVFRRPSLLRLAKLIRNCDVLHLAGPAMKPMILAKILDRKILIQHHGYQAACPNGLLLDARTQSSCDRSFLRGDLVNCSRCRARTVGWLLGILSVAVALPRRWLALRAHANVTVSNHVASRLELPYSSTIHNGTTGEPGQAPIDRGLTEIACLPCFIFVGRLVAEKGAEILLRAAAHLATSRRIRVKIIGDGPDRARLERLAAELGINGSVHFTGCVQGVELTRIIQDSIAVIMPSICEEASGLSAIEQLMRGSLVIAANIGGVSEVVGSAGLKFPPGNAVELARCMKLAMDDPELRRALGVAARLRAQELFTAERMVNEHLSVYRAIFSRSGQVRKRVLRVYSNHWLSSVSTRLRYFIT